jgi:hypothetical protein
MRASGTSCLTRPTGNLLTFAVDAGDDRVDDGLGRDLFGTSRSRSRSVSTTGGNTSKTRIRVA